jgi:glycosyltransferase involved in cell wall biosynthesis
MYIKFHQIDLSQPLEPIYVDERYSWLFVVVCWGYRPLKVVRLQCLWDSRTFSADQLRRKVLQACGRQLWESAVAGTLEKLNGDLQDRERELPPISVVVCTRDHPALLERCLESLAQLDYPTYEVVVVDNGSRDERVAQVVARTPFRYAREETPGLDWARNRGIQEAAYDIIAYIDDDAIATPGWLRGIAYGFEDSEVMAVTGMVLPAEIETTAQNDFERYGGMSKGCTSYTIRACELNTCTRFWASNWGVGTNMAFRRATFEAIGSFEVALDVGTPTNGAGDIEFLYRTVSAGYALHYEPAAMIRHLHRRDAASLKRQIYNNGRSFVAYLMTIARKQPHMRGAMLRFGLRWWLWEWLLRRVILSVLKRDKWTLRYALIELSGIWSGPAAYFKAQRIARRLSAKRQTAQSTLGVTQPR